LFASGFDHSDNTNDEGFMGLMDFNSLVLTREKPILRAAATQRECKPSDEISNKVEIELASLLQMEFNFLETLERMKNQLE
jgi:hypothetical protein